MGHTRKLREHGGFKVYIFFLGGRGGGGEEGKAQIEAVVDVRLMGNKLISIQIQGSSLLGKTVMGNGNNNF
jgi:hypothetical protein